MSPIGVGSIIKATNGFHTLAANEPYYFLCNDQLRKRVLLVHFEQREPRTRPATETRNVRREIPLPRVALHIIARDAFESAVKHCEKPILLVEPPTSLPPWLKELEGINLAAVDELRRNVVIKHCDRLARVMSHLQGLLTRIEEILSADDPDEIINEHARHCTPPQNEARLRTRFYTYLVFGRNPNALHYPIHLIGRTPKRVGQVRRGRHSALGRDHGSDVTDPMVEKIEQGYRQFARIGVTIAAIYQRTVIRVFGCKVRKNKKKQYEFFHPDGDRWPSYGQFNYYVNKIFGLSKKRSTLFGRIRYRNREAPTKGSFSEIVANLMECTNEDAYYEEELPIGFLEGETLPPLCVVEKRDDASGFIVGMGFSQGAESGSAYRAAKFCAAIGGPQYFALFGIPLTEEDWPAIGASPFDITDQGPGATKEGAAKDAPFQPPIRQITPVRSGQSNAVAESVHPKPIKDEEGPHFLVSNKTASQLIVRALLSAKKKNLTINTERALTDDIFGSVTGLSPRDVWVELAERGRSDAIHMDFDDAVRQYLIPTDVVAHDGSIHLHRSRFNSGDLQESGYFDTISSTQRIPVQGYVLEGCLRHIWVDIKGRMYQLDRILGRRVGNRFVNITLAELQQKSEELTRKESEHREVRSATQAAVEEEYRGVTGKNWSAARRVKGTPKHGRPAGKREANEAKRSLGGKTRVR